MKDITQYLDESRQLEAERDAIMQEDAEIFHKIPAISTARQIEQWRKLYAKRASKHRFRIVISAIIPVIDNPYSWRCWLSLCHEKGIHRVRGYEQRMVASVWFVEKLIGSSDWTEKLDSSGGVTFTQYLENPIIGLPF